MATTHEPATAAPAPHEYGITSRVLAVPLVSSSLETIHSTLSNSPYTKGVYETTQYIANSAYGTAQKLSSPIYPAIKPVVNAADGIASKGFDTLHTMLPYPFEATPETIYQDIKKAPEDAKNVAYKVIDDRIKTPAYGLAKGVDHSLTPIVDLLEAILIKLHVNDPEHSRAASTNSEASTSTAVSEKAQVTRAKELVFGAKDHIITLTTEQAKALKDQNVYIQRASAHVDALNATVAGHYENAQAGINAYKEKGAETIGIYKGKGMEFGKETQARIYALSNSMLVELEKIQATTASLPKQIQTTLKPLTDAIGSTVTEMKGILMSKEEGVGLSEKANRLTNVVKERVGPIVEQGIAVYAATLDKFVNKAENAKAESTGGAHVNSVSRDEHTE